METAQRLRHRHFVALPLFAALLVLPLFPLAQHPSLAASVASADGIRTLADGAQVRPADDAVIETNGSAPFLRKGSALFTSETILQVRTAACDILAMDGAFHVIAGDASATVSAITAPVLVAVGTERAIVPAGMQLRVSGPLTGLSAGFAAWRQARVAAALPAHFLRDQIVALQDFAEGTAVLPAPVQALPPREAVSDLQFPAAQERNKEAWRQSVLGALRFRIEAQDAAGARSILDDAAYQPALRDPRSLATLVALAGRTQDGAASLRPALLAALSDRHDVWVLAAVHPSLYTGAWAAVAPALRPEERALLAFALPEADRAPEGFSLAVLRLWERNVAAFIAEQPEPLSLVEPLLSSLLPVAQQYAAWGYPERAKALASSLLVFAKPVQSRVGQELQSALKEVENLARPSIDLFAPPASSVSSAASSLAASSSASSVAAIPEAQRVAIVTNALERGGALFSLQTVIEPKADGVSVRVRDILFSSASGDIPFTFDVHAGTLQVSAIVRSGTLLPYPLAMDAFLAWVRE